MTTTVRQRIELGFESFGRLLCRRPLVAILFALMVAAALISQLPKMTLDTSTEGFLHQEDPTLVQYDAFREQFGRDEVVVLAVSAPEIFSAPFMEKLTALHEELRAGVPHLDDITSLVNARDTRGDEGALIVQDLLEEVPTDAAGWAALKARAEGNPLYRNLLLSEDGGTTTVVIKTDAFSEGEVPSEADALAAFDEGGFDDGGFEEMPAGAVEGEAEPRLYLSDEENSAVVAAVEAIAARYHGEDFQVHVAGSPVVVDALKRAMMTNMGRFTLLGVVTIALALGLMFRRASGVVLPLMVVVLSLLSTLGTMALSGVPFTLPTQILPSFLLAVGVGASVHLLAIFYHHLQAGHERHASIVHALGHSGLAVVMTSLTTAAGLASFAGAEVAPVADLGRFAAVGVLIALFYTLVLLPALLAVVPVKVKGQEAAVERSARMDRMLTGAADLSTGRPKAVLLVCLALFVVAAIGVSQVRFSHTPYKWISLEEPARQGSDFIDATLGGASALEMIVDTGEENGLYQPQVMASLAQLQVEVEAMAAGDQVVGKATSPADILREINRALNENRAEFYKIPESRELIAQEFLLFENSGSDDLEDFVDSQFRTARFTIKTPWVDAVEFPGFIDGVRARFQEVLGGGVEVVATGMNALLARTLTATIFSMAESYIIAAVVITVMMVVLMGNLRLGLLSMLPNFMPIFVTIGLMGWLGLPLDLFTMLIGSIAIGLAVDDTIHFLHNYRRYHHQTGDVAEAVRRTLLTSGRAMVVTTAVLSIGFFIYMFSTLSNLINFGLLTGFTIINALLADLFMAPALMAMLHGGRLEADDAEY